MAGKKRTVNGQVKPQPQPHPPTEHVTMADPTPPYGQPQPPSSKTAESERTAESTQAAKAPESTSQRTSKPAQRTSTPNSNRKNRQKRPRLPNNTKITKRPLLHPSLPTPFSSSTHPKTLYLTASTPYIPTLKRIRHLLTQIATRSKQSQSAIQKRHGRRGGYAEANGRLEARHVEREIADEVVRKNGRAMGIQGGEQVYVKATGRAIPRALEVGVYFQGEADCRVGVEMGSVKAVDDVEVGEEGGGGEEQDIPETRIRTLSSVTVSIGFK